MIMNNIIVYSYAVLDKRIYFFSDKLISKTLSWCPSEKEDLPRGKLQAVDLLYGVFIGQANVTA